MEEGRRRPLRERKPQEPHLQALSAVALGAIPLDDDFPKVQQEDIALVKTVPAHFHLWMRSRHRSGGSLRCQVEPTDSGQDLPRWP